MTTHPSAGGSRPSTGPAARRGLTHSAPPATRKRRKRTCNVCTTCGEEMAGETAEARHVKTTGHARYESTLTWRPT